MSWKPTLFTILSVPNSYGRIIVGDSNGEIFTLGDKALQELISQKLMRRPLHGGIIKTIGEMQYQVSLRKGLQARSIFFWSQSLFEIGTICAFERKNERWYLWSIGFFDPVRL